MKKHAFISLGIIFFWASLLAAQAASPEGTIEGSVSGYTPDKAKAFQVVLIGKGLVEDLVLDPKGRFKRDKLPFGTYRVWIESDLHPPVSTDDLSVREKAPIQRVEIPLLRSSALEGKVLDQASGKGLPGIDVIAEWISSPALSKKGLTLKNLAAATDSDGSFLIPNLAEGDYRVFAYAPGFEISKTVDLKLGPGKPKARVDLSLVSKAAAEEARKKLVSISGQVLAGAQAPPEPVAVFLLDSERKVVDGEKTEPDGSFHFKAEPGAYVVSVDPTGLEGFDLKEAERGVPALKPGQAATGINFLFEPVARVHGIIRDEEGKPVPWVEVTVRSEKAAEPITDVTDASGAYELEGLTAGEWHLRARAGEEEILYQLLTIDPVKEKELEISFTQAVRRDEILGEVRSKDGKPLAGVRVVAEREPPVTELYGPLKTGPDGRFHFKGLPGWTYTVTAVGQFGEATKTSVPAGSVELTGLLILVLPATAEEALAQDPEHQRVSALIEKWEKTAGDPEALRKLAGPIEEAFGPGAAVEGTVVTQTGAPVPGVVVFFLDSSKEPIPDSVVTTDENGVFKIPAVPDGSYFIQAGRSAQEKTEPEPVSVSNGRLERPIQLRLP